MSLWLPLLLALAIAGALGGGALLRASDARRREALEALAAQRGWSLNITKQALGRPPILRMAPRGGGDWQTEVRRSAAQGKAAPRSVTLFHNPNVVWQGDVMLLGPPVATSEELLEGAVLSQLGGRFAQRMIGQVLGQATAAALPELSVWPGADGVTLFASSNPTHRTDLTALTRIYRDWQPLRSGETGAPLVILGPAGLKVGLRHGLSTAAELESFIDFGIALARHLSRP